MRKRREVERFLQDLKAKINVFDIAFRPRDKNMDALAELDIHIIPYCGIPCFLSTKRTKVMTNKIECPYCEGKASLQKKTRELPYRKEVFKVTEHFYKCEKCGEEFTTTESDTITLTQAHNQYREKYNILFPEEIVAIKEMYELSATKMSEVLGLGVNGYSNYEKGEMPNPAISNLIKTAARPNVFSDLLENARVYFTENGFKKIKMRIIALLNEAKKIRPFYAVLNVYNDPNNYTGYKKIDPNKIANLVTCFIGSSNPYYNSRLKLNKQLFYTDFRHYKMYGRSITGLSYRAIKYGPVPANYDNIYTYLENEQVIVSNWAKTSNGSALESFTTDAEFKSTVFSRDELETIGDITTKFKDIPSWDMVELSHKERAWKELEPGKQLISYQEYAFDLQGA
jgi:putative zinc finger/helix-turn-helix YgiT family protein